MGKQNKLGQIVLILTLLVTSVFSAHGQRSDEYKVYDAVIGHMFAGGITQFDMNAKIDQIVIRERTVSKDLFGPEKQLFEELKSRLRELTDETIADYKLTGNNEIQLKRDFDIPFKYTFITDKKRDKIFRPTNDGSHRLDHSWDEYYKIYPGSAGYNSLSRVGFDKAKHQALVYFVNYCGSLCGTGTFVLLENHQNTWSVKEAAMMWIS